MAQGTLTRLTYERLGILLTDAPAYKESGTKYTDLIRVQSMDYGFSHQAVDVKAVGADRLISRNGQSPIVRSPDVNCNIEYLFAEGQNEIGAGMYIGKSGSILSNFFAPTATDDINILVVASDKDENRDLNFLKTESDFENYNVIGIGNAYLTNYSYSAAVGSLPTASFNYAGSNVKFDLYSTQDRPTLPAIKPGADNLNSSEQVLLSASQMRDAMHDMYDEGYVFDSHIIPEIAATKPGDIKIEIEKISGKRGGTSLHSVDAAVQSISINLPIPRQDIYGMGSNYVFDRKLKLPVIGEMSIDMVLRGYTQDQVDSFLTQTDVYNLKINHPINDRILGSKGSTYVLNDYYYIAIDKNEWRRIAMLRVTRSQSGQVGDTQVDLAGNFYYVCIEDNTWGAIPLTYSSISSSEEIVYTNNFIHVKYGSNWRKFAVTLVDYDLVGPQDSFTFANNITFEVNRAQLKQQNYTHSIGSEVMVSSLLTFDVTKTDGLRMYFQ